MGLRSCVILLLAAGLSGCAGGGRGGGGSGGDTEATATVTSGDTSPGDTAATATEEQFPTPTTEDTRPTAETRGPASGHPVVTLASLPIGGNANTEPDDPARQCVDISWIVTTAANPVIPPGYAVEVTDVVFSAAGFEVVRSGCGSSRPNCVGHMIRAGQDTCDLAVRALPKADPSVAVTVGLTGTLYCPDSVGQQRCQDFADAVAQEPGTTIPLNQAPEPTSDTGTPTATDTGTDTATENATPTGTDTATGSGG